MAHPYHHHRAEHVAKAHAHIRKTGHKPFARGGHVHDDEAEDEKMIASGVHKHEAHMHKGEPKTKLKRGGHVEGEKARHHMGHRRRAEGGKTDDEGGGWKPSEKMPGHLEGTGKNFGNSKVLTPTDKGTLAHGGHVHRARGGKTGGKHTKVNVIVAPQGGGAHPPMPMPARPPMAAGPAPGAGGPPPMPPPAMTRPGMGMPGAGGPPMGAPPPGMMRAKGGRIPHMEAGAGSGEGRLEKIREYGKR